ncbi:MAG: helix-turn-helix transcriptional regulator [Candidatus Shapirobacteria bacterium]
MEIRKVTKKDIQFGRKLQRVRKKTGITQEKLSELTGLSTTFIGLMETGRRKPSLESLQKIASKLKVNIKELF